MSNFDQKSLDWCNANVESAKPCPFCGERLIVHTDHHGAWLAHKDEATGECFESIAQVMDADDLARWNTRSGT